MHRALIFSIVTLIIASFGCGSEIPQQYPYPSHQNPYPNHQRYSVGSNQDHANSLPQNQGQDSDSYPYKDHDSSDPNSGSYPYEDHGSSDPNYIPNYKASKSTLCSYFYNLNYFFIENFRKIGKIDVA